MPTKRNYTCFIQARMNSSRLPGKILMPIGSKPLLKLVLDRVNLSKLIDEVVVITTNNSIDNKIADFCLNNSIKCFRGEENDVLNRFYSASLVYNSSYYVRINSDCPFIDWNLIDECINFAGQNYDYIASILSNSFPIGQHVEVIKRKAINDANSFAMTKSDREHVTPYIYNNPDKFSLYSITSDLDLSAYRLTIDYPEDLIMASSLLEKCNSDIPPYNEIISLLAEFPEIVKINSHYTKSQYIDNN